jgi:hypothetical protein
LDKKERKINPDNINLQIDEISFWGENENYKGGMGVSWSSNIGFGELNIVMDKEENLLAYTEYMDCQEDKSFTEKILQLLLQKLIIVE